MKFRSKIDGEEYEAVQWNGKWSDIIAWLDSISPGGRFSIPIGYAPPIQRGSADTLVVFHSECEHVVLNGDWIVLDAPVFQPYSESDFESKFEKLTP